MRGLSPFPSPDSLIQGRPGQYTAFWSKPWQKTGPHTAWAGLALSTGFLEILHKGPLQAVHLGFAQNAEDVDSCVRPTGERALQAVSLFMAADR